MAIQAALPRDQVPIGMALVIFAQTFGGALFLSFAETDFSNSLIKAINTFAPNVSAKAINDAGASGVRAIVPKPELASVLLAYNQAVQHAFYLAAGSAAVTLVFCLGMGWKSVKKPKVAKTEA